MAPQTIEPTTALVGCQVREADGRTVVGDVEGVRPSGIRIHKIPGHLRRADLLGHYGLFDAEGRGSEPFLHPDQK